MKCAGEINAGDIAWPLIALMLFEPIAQIENVIRRDNAFAGQNVDRIGDGARFSEIRRLQTGHFLQITQAVGEHFRRRGGAAGFRFAQEIHHVSRDETDVIARFRHPVTESPLIVLPASENAEGVFELFVDLRAAQTEVGLIR